MHLHTAIIIVMSTILTFGHTAPVHECGAPEAIQELLQNQLNTPINCEEEHPVDPRILFKLIKCPEDANQWVQNLETVFQELKKENKLRSLYSLLLTAHSKMIEELNVSEEIKQKLLSFHNGLPQIAKDVLAGQICSKFGDGGDSTETLKVFMDWNSFTQKDPEADKFLLRDDGPTSVVIGISKNENITLLMDRYSASNDIFDFPVIVENGELERIPPGEEHNRATVYLCKGVQIGLHEILLPRSPRSSDICFFNKFITSILQNAP